MRQKVNGDGNIVAGRDVNITLPPAPPAPPPPLSNKFDLSHLPRTDATLFGREDELALIDKAWQDERTNVLVLTAMGGAGKTALMQKWIDDEHWRGADAVYTWSFYSQGSSEDKQASAAEFFDSALAWFGHDGSVIRSEHDKGVKLAELVCRQRTLLLLDGLEPLQYPVGGAMNGALKDKGLLSLCKQLAAKNNGLLLISSRQPVTELEGRPHHQQHELKPLTAAAGLALFRAAGVKGEDAEITDTVKAYGGHALSLNLLATYLTEYEHGHILNQYTLRELTEFPEETYGSSHAFKVMAGHERKLVGRPELQILFCLGLFDRPVSAATMSCLRKEGVLDLPNDERVFRAACGRLRKQGLLNTARPEQPQNLDTHPLVRQYFGKRLAELHPESWQQAHVRLYEYFKELPEKELPDTLEEMEPLFAAVRHGCIAGLHQKALDEVYRPRIKRKKKHYVTKRLGAVSTNLAVLTNFFAEPWYKIAPELKSTSKALILSWAAFHLRGLGRLIQAIDPMQSVLTTRIKQKKWKNATVVASNLTELFLINGLVTRAIETGQQAVELAEQSRDTFHIMSKMTTLADTLHQDGQLEEARIIFVEAEQIEKKRQSQYNMLYSLRGIRYCDLILSFGNWKNAQERSEQTIKIAEKNDLILNIALNQISLGRAAIQKSISLAQFVAALPSGLAPDQSVLLANASSNEQTSQAMSQAQNWLEQAVAGLRKASREDYLPRALLARAAWYRWAIVLLGQTDTIVQAAQDLQETEEIAQCGGMRLHLIDFHLEAARLSLTAGQDILNRTAAEHLAAAKKGIKETGYNRRLPEVANIEGLLAG